MTGILLSKLELDMLQNPEKAESPPKRNLSYRLKPEAQRSVRLFKSLNFLLIMYLRRS